MKRRTRKSSVTRSSPPVLRFCVVLHVIEGARNTSSWVVFKEEASSKPGNSSSFARVSYWPMALRPDGAKMLMSRSTMMLVCTNTRFVASSPSAIPARRDLTDEETAETDLMFGERSAKHRTETAKAA